MSRLTQEGTAEPVSRKTKFLGWNEDDSEILGIFFLFQLTTNRIGNLTRLIHTLPICDDHTYMMQPSYIFRKNLNASKPSEHPPQVEECLKV